MPKGGELGRQWEEEEEVVQGFVDRMRKKIEEEHNAHVDGDGDVDVDVDEEEKKEGDLRDL